MGELRMKAHIRGTGAAGHRIESQQHLPDTIRVGDSFMLDAVRDQKVAIVGMRRNVGPDGQPFTTVVVAPAFARPSHN
jgi:hypothetical protein